MCYFSSACSSVGLLVQGVALRRMAAEHVGDSATPLRSRTGVSGTEHGQGSAAEELRVARDGCPCTWQDFERWYGSIGWLVHRFAAPGR